LDASLKNMQLKNEISEFIQPLFGEVCSRVQVIKPKSLWLGFGPKIFQDERRNSRLHNKWEMGTYYSAWRIIRNSKIVCASNDSVDEEDELESVIQEINLGPISTLDMSSDFDVRIGFHTEIFIEFLGTTSDDDHSVDIFNYSSQIVAQFTPGSGWRIGPSNLPWNEQ